MFAGVPSSVAHRLIMSSLKGLDVSILQRPDVSVKSTKTWYVKPTKIWYIMSTKIWCIKSTLYYSASFNEDASNNGAVWWKHLGVEDRLQGKQGLTCKRTLTLCVCRERSRTNPLSYLLYRLSLKHSARSVVVLSLAIKN